MKSSILILSILLSQAAYSKDHYSATSLGTRSIALELCACKNLMGQTNSFCEDYVFKGIPLSKSMFTIKYDTKEKSTYVSSKMTLGFVNSTAMYRQRTCLYE